MSKWPRIVVPGLPHHITHRGTRRQKVFFEKSDYEFYRNILRQSCNKHGVQIWAYCLMPNHVHMIAVPEGPKSLSLAFGRAHQCYSRIINSQNDWMGHLWEQRYSSIPMDSSHLLMAARYVELNPVRAKMVVAAENYEWSSARAHLLARNDRLVDASHLLELVPNWRQFLTERLLNSEAEKLRKLEKTGYPAGDEDFLDAIEAKFHIKCRPQKTWQKIKKLIINSC
jgi:putative transposase